MLRCNKKHPTSGFVAFSASDPRLPFALPLPLDPRIHFALNCGAKSCPAIRAYHPTHPSSAPSTLLAADNSALLRYNDSNLQRGLAMAAHTFCAQHVRVEVPNGWIHDSTSDQPWRMTGRDAKLILSKIFLW